VPDADFDAMLDFALAPGDGNHAIVATQDGLLWRVSLDGSGSASQFGDISDRIAVGSEEGLLSIAFSPDFETDGHFYMYYTKGSPEPSVVSRFEVSGGVLDEDSETVVIEVPQPYANHNGGRILFGPDGYLYLTTGDGGSGGDPDNNSQDKDSLLGKVLRIDVTGQPTYAAPPDNPFVGVAGRDEIWAYGLRNPWRASFDRLTGDLWLGDVGQGEWEEVDRIEKGGNYGWRCYEGFSPYDTSGCPPAGSLEFPRAVYDHSDGQAVAGGYVYRGSAMPELYGWYVYADFYTGRLWAVDAAPGAAGEPVLLLDSGYLISSFTELPDGEILVLTYTNAIYRLERN
jgi:glucose/arabinose dehydrogenase